MIGFQLRVVFVCVLVCCSGYAADPESPQIAALKEAVRTSKTHSTLDFWDSIKKQGTPVIEPIKGDKDYSLVTFLWRNEWLEKEVALIGSFTEWDPVNTNLNPIPKTDVWYKTFRVPNDLRASYRFAIHGPKVSEEVSDPLNPKKISYAIDSEHPEVKPYTLSILEMPKAPQETWLKKRSEALAGGLEAFMLKSSNLDASHRLWVYTPPVKKAKGEAYSLIIFLDGEEYAETINAISILDNLHDAKIIRPTIAVFVENIDERSRKVELSCCESFTDFLAVELVPWIKEKYSIQSDPAKIVIAGASQGGLAAAYAALRYPNVFGNVLSQSGTFYWGPKKDYPSEWLTQKYLSSPKMRLRFYMDVGKLERSPHEELAQSNLTVNRKFRQALVKKGYTVRYNEYCGGHDVACWRESLAHGLIFLLR